MTPKPPSTAPITPEATVVWLPPSATSFACLCERCLETAREHEVPFADALPLALVRGALDPAIQFLRLRCGAGHELVLRRVERPPGLARHDSRQLQLA